MCRGNKVLLIVAAFLFSLVISSAVRADLAPIYSMGGLPVYTLGNMLGNANMYMTARAQGAYAFSDYSHMWGLNNLAMGAALGLGGGMGLGAMNLYNNWMQSYPMAPMYGYSTALNDTPWMGYSNYPYGYGFSNYSLPMQSNFSPSLYNYDYNYSFDYPWLDNEDNED